MKKLMISLLLALSFASCGKHDIGTALGNTVEFAAQSAGKIIEKVGQIPRIVGNKALGTESTTDEELDDLSRQVNSMYSEFQEEFNKTSEELEVLRDSNQATQEELDALIQEHQSLLDEYNSTTKRTLKKIRRLRNRLNNLRESVNNLEVVCDYYYYIVTGCELQ